MAEAVTKQQVMDLLAAAAYLETDGASMPGAEADRIAATLRALASAPRAEAVEERYVKYLTVVYRDIRPGDEARELLDHPKMSAASWSHALHERDAMKEQNHA